MDLGEGKDVEVSQIDVLDSCRVVEGRGPSGGCGRSDVSISVENWLDGREREQRDVTEGSIVESFTQSSVVMIRVLRDY